MGWFVRTKGVGSSGRLFADNGRMDSNGGNESNMLPDTDHSVLRENWRDVRASRYQAMYAYVSVEDTADAKARTPLAVIDIPARRGLFVCGVCACVCGVCVNVCVNVCVMCV